MYLRKGKIISGIGIDAIGTIISVLVGLLVLPFFFHYISKNEYGLWLAINGLIALISIVDLGTDQYLTTIASDDEKFFSSMIGHHILSTLIVKFVIACIFVGVGIIIYIFIPHLLVIELSAITAAKNAYLIALLALILILFGGTISTLLYARHHFSLVSGLASLSGILASFVTIIFLTLDFGISAFPIALVCSALIQYTFLFGFLRKNYSHIKFSMSNFRFQNQKEMINYSMSFQILRWVFTLRTQYIVIAINNLVGPNAVVLYSLTNRLPQMVTMFASKIALPFFPTFAEYFTKEQREMAASTFKKVNRLLIRFSLFAAIVCFSVNKAFVSEWVGEDSFAGMGVLFLLTFYAFVYAAMGAFGIIIYSSKKFERWTIWSIIEMVCAVTLSYLLSFSFGLVGVIAGFALTSLITQVYLFRIVLKQLHISSFDFAKGVLNYALVTNVSTIIASTILIGFMNISGWLEIFSVCFFVGLLHLFTNEGILMLKSKEVGFRAKFLSVVKL